MNEQLRKALEDADACFEAARIEGLAEALAETQDECLKDLVERRLLWAQQEIQSALAALQQAAQEPQPVGIAGAMPGSSGFTMAAFKASEVPVGTKLYATAPAKPAEQEKACQHCDGEGVVSTNELDIAPCIHCQDIDDAEAEQAPQVKESVVSLHEQADVLKQAPPLPPYDYYVTLENGDDYGCWSRETMRAYAEQYAAWKIAALRSEQAPAGEVPSERIREIFLANGFTIKDGNMDLKPYVYQAARALIAALTPPAVPPGLRERLDELRVILQLATPSIDLIHERGPDDALERAWLLFYDEIMPLLSAAPAAPTKPKNLREVKRTSDFSVELVFSSCRAASEFYLSAAPGREQPK